MPESTRFQDEFKHADAEIFYNSKLFSLDRTQVKIITEMLHEMGKLNGKEKSGTLLDVGCGLGFATSLMASYFEHTIGIDPSSYQIEKVCEMNGSERNRSIEFKVGTAENLPVADNSVDVIIGIFSIHYFDVTCFATECRRVLKQGGVAIFYVDYIASVASLENAELPLISDVFADMRKRCFMIADALSHPARHVMDLNDRVYGAIKWPGKKRILRELEVTCPLRGIRNVYLSVPFYDRLGPTADNPVVKTFQDAKERWGMADAKDEDIKVLATYDVSVIVLNK